VQPVFIGDVQGCAVEFEELLSRIRCRFGDRHELWLVGDLVNRGPENLRLLERVAGLVERGRAHYILGNHEVGLLQSALGHRPLRPLDTFHDILDSPDLSFWVEWIRRRPLVDTGVLGSRPFAMVHAGVHPDWDLPEIEKRARRVEERLAAADPETAWGLLGAVRATDADRDVLDRLTCIRSVDSRGGWSKDEPTDPEDAWHRRWSARGHSYGIVYGHWSLQGLHVARRLRGLDTGCVHHARGRDGYLTAWMPDPRAPDPFGVPDDRFLQVRAHRRYVTEPGGVGER
jgi:bis(5'-nucleosyl)-tetraphosphatase (symmetrical)